MDIRTVYTPTVEHLLRPGDYIKLPVSIPGYGVIQTQRGWRVFMKSYRHLCEGHKNLVNYAQMLEEDVLRLQAEIDRLTIDGPLEDAQR